MFRSKYFKIGLSTILSCQLLVSGSATDSVRLIQPNSPSSSHPALAAYQVDPNKSLETNLIVDPVGAANANFRNIETKVTHVSGQLYRGNLNAADVTPLVDVPGIHFERNLPTGVIPPIEPNTAKSKEKLYWDTETLVSDTDANLRTTRYESGIDGTGILIAIIDTGVDSEAVGLTGNKVVHREDFSSPPEDESCSDDGYLDPHGHGTHVASIAAGSDSLLEGVAPGAQIVDLRVLNCAGSGWMSDVDEALQWLIDHRQSYPVKVVNLSLGTNDGQQNGLDSTSILINRLVALGTFVSVAAGNGGTKSTNLYSPATSEFAVTVAAATTTRFGSYLAPFSSHGPTTDGRAGIDVTAPGSGIRAAQSTKFSGVWRFDPETTKAGTSMAAPYVAGTAALLLQQHPEYLPSGELCEISELCPSGVNRESMTNPVLDHFKTSDWFESGIDPHSGAGLLLPSASLLGQNIPADKTIRASTDGDSDTVIRFDPSPAPKLVTLLFDSSWQTNIFDWSQRFNIGFTNHDAERIDVGRPCAILSWGICLLADQRNLLYTYLLPSSDTPLYMSISTSSQTQMTISVDAYQGQISSMTGVAVSPIDLTAAGSGVMKVTRTSDSETSTYFTISATGGVGTPMGVLLPAGPAGTEVSVQLQAPANPVHTLERVILRTPDDKLLYSEVRLSELTQGRIRFPDSVDTGLSGIAAGPFVADDGTILSESGGAGMRNGSGYPNPFIVQPGSLTPTPLNFNQTSSSMIFSLGLSQDGTTGLFGEFPAGAGIVPGDEEMFYTYFVTNLSTMESHRVGPSSSHFSSMNDQNQSYPEFKISSDGSMVAWTSKLGDGDLPWTLAVNRGVGLSQETVLDHLAGRFDVSLQAISNDKILVKVQSAGSLQLRLYDLAGNYTVLNEAGQSPQQANFSKNGNAVGFFDYGNGLYCWANGTVRKFTPNQPIGTYWYNEVRVADDCSWITTTRAFFTPDFNGIWRGEDSALLRVNANGTVDTLATSKENTWFWNRWKSNSDGTQFLTITPESLEPGDVNNQVDMYRGLYSSPDLSNPIKKIPSLYWYQDVNSFYNGRLALVNTYSDSDSPVQFQVISGGCHLSQNNVLVAESATGLCRVKLFIEESATHFASSLEKTLYISPPATLKKRTPTVVFQDVSNLVFSVKTNVINFPHAGGSVEILSGPCQVDSQLGVVSANSGTGSCQIKFKLPEDALYYAGEWIRTYQLSRATLLPGYHTIYIPDHMNTGQTMQVELRGLGIENPVVTVTGPCRIDGMTLTALAPGTCNVTADIAQNDNINAFRDTVQVTITGKLQSSINFLGSYLRLSAGVPVKLTSTTSSNGQITYSVISGPCRIEGDSLYLTSRYGVCLVKASTAETEIYFAASQQAQFTLATIVPKLTHAKMSTPSKGGFVYGLAEAK